MSLTLLLLVAGTGCARPQQERALYALPQITSISTGRISVPMVPDYSGVPVVQATGRQAAAAPMMVDTGAAAMVISRSYAAEQGLVIQPASFKTTDALGRARQAPGTVRYDIFRLGEAEFRSFDALVLDSAVLERFSGVMGLQLFYDRLLTLDFANFRLNLGEGELPPPNGRDILPAEFDRYGRAWVTISIGPMTQKVLIDTGYSGSLAIPDEWRSRLPGMERAITIGNVSLWHGDVRGYVARLKGDVVLGGTRFRRPAIELGVAAQPVIGMDFLCNFAVTFDQKNQRVRFARHSSTDIPSKPIRYFGIKIDPETLRVLSVDPGGGAEKGGIKVGDTVLNIRPAAVVTKSSELSLDHPAFGQENSDTLLVEIRRDFKHLTLAITATTLE